MGHVYDRLLTGIMAKLLILIMGLVLFVITIPTIVGAVDNDNAPTLKEDWEQYIGDQIETQLGGNIFVGDTLSINLGEIFDGAAYYDVVSHNQDIAEVSYESESAIYITALASGSSIIEVKVGSGSTSDSMLNALYRLTVLPIVDKGVAGINIDDIVKHLKLYPNRLTNLDHRQYLGILLHNIASFTTPANRGPNTSERALQVFLKPTENLVLYMADFFNDPDGDALTYTYTVDQSVAEPLLNGELDIDGELGYADNSRNCKGPRR